MRWKTWWSVALISLLATGCGGGGGGNNSQLQTVSTSTDYGSKSAVGIAADCSQLTGFFSELLTLTNKARQDAGVGPLRFSYQLGQSAQNYAQYMGTANFFSHTGLDGSNPTSRIAATGYQAQYVGENLGAGYTNATSVFQGWMASAGHRANILAADFTEVGFGAFDATGKPDSTYGFYWAQNFAKPVGGNSNTQIYIPNTCGISVASGDVTAAPQVAGFSTLSHAPNAGPNALPSGVPPAGTMQPFLVNTGAGPVAAVLSATTSSSESVPEPTMVFGLASLGLALRRDWRDR
ncbi:MAG: CAP domain-containing protein [Phormidesmis sp. RL_2_1]|nr:CAP domain-containing protein [Phormidesmis sp. RL_2_1]